jgi:hypothetical protein
MQSVDQAVQVYQELSNWYVQQGQAQMRDRFMVLAADAMLTAGRKDEAERLRSRLLQVNPHHLFKPFGSLAEAMMKSKDVRNYVEGLRRTYPPEKAAELLDSVRAERLEKPASPPVPPERPEPPHAAKNSGAGTGEPLKVYRLQEEKQPESPAAPPAPAGRGAPAKETPRPTPPRPETRPASTVPLARPVPARSPAPASAWREPSPPSPWRKESVEADRPEPTAGAWVASTLFWLLLLVGLGLAVYTFAGPFLAI